MTTSEAIDVTRPHWSPLDSVISQSPHPPWRNDIVAFCYLIVFCCLCMLSTPSLPPLGSDPLPRHHPAPRTSSTVTRTSTSVSQPRSPRTSRRATSCAAESPVTPLTINTGFRAVKGRNEKFRKRNTAFFFSF